MVGNNAGLKACLGAETISTDNDMEKCVYCGSCVAWDLVDHPFFGFESQGCTWKEEFTEGDRE